MFHRLAVHSISRYFAGMAVLFSPPMPQLPPDDITGLGVLFRLKQNGFGAFPARCFHEPVLSLRALGRPLVVAAGPEAIKAVLPRTRHPFSVCAWGGVCSVLLWGGHSSQ